MSAHSPRRPAVLPAGLLLFAFAIPLVAYWPGIMTWDSAREYGMALKGPIDDWHTPVLIILWRLLLHIAPGPGPMLALQLIFYVGGWALLARWAWRTGRPRLAAALAACSLFPIALVIEGAILKDSLMAGALLVALGLLAPERPARGARIGATALLLFAATLRFNALFACLPLFVAALPAHWRASCSRLAGWVIASLLVLAAATPLADRTIGARPSGVELSQVLFDLGGITYYSGEDAFPPVGGVRDPVAVNRRCYDPALWDRYAWWTDSPCPIGWANAGGWFAAHGRSPFGWWLGAIARHPIAYAEHRLRHFAMNTRAVSLGHPEPLIPPQPDRSVYGYAPPANPVRAAVEAAATLLARTPLGWPIFWIALAAGSLIFTPRERLTALAASSALLFGLSYIVMSVASDLRYHLWTMLAAMLALAPAASKATALPRMRLALAAAPAATVGLLGGAARLLIRG